MGTATLTSRSQAEPIYFSSVERRHGDVMLWGLLSCLHCEDFRRCVATTKDSGGSQLVSACNANELINNALNIKIALLLFA